MLSFLRPAFLISNIGLNFGKYAVSPGTYCKTSSFTLKYVVVTLPSGFLKNISLSFFCFIGKNSGTFNYKNYKGKSSVFKNNIKRIIVRSCAKNPIDHPNGGRTRGKQKIKTP